MGSYPPPVVLLQLHWEAVNAGVPPGVSGGAFGQVPCLLCVLTTILTAEGQGAGVGGGGGGWGVREVRAHTGPSTKKCTVHYTHVPQGGGNKEKRGRSSHAACAGVRAGSGVCMRGGGGGSGKQRPGAKNRSTYVSKSNARRSMSTQHGAVATNSNCTRPTCGTRQKPLVVWLFTSRPFTQVSPTLMPRRQESRWVGSPSTVKSRIMQLGCVPSSAAALWALRCGGQWGDLGARVKGARGEGWGGGGGREARDAQDYVRAVHDSARVQHMGSPVHRLEAPGRIVPCRNDG